MTELKAIRRGPLFELGQLGATPAVMALVASGWNAIPYLARHIKGDWGDLSDEDKAENDLSVREGFRILSAYNLPEGLGVEKIWIITERDRSATTILTPGEY